MMRSKTKALTFMFALLPLGPLAVDVYLPSFPLMISSLHANDSQMQLTISVYLFSFGVSQIIAGPISDRKGRRFSALLGLLFYALGSLFAFTSIGVYQLYLGRFFQGVGAAFTSITALAWVRDNYEGPNVGKWLSFMGGMISIVPTVAPMLGSILALSLGWQGSFYFMFSLAFVLILVAINFRNFSNRTEATVGLDNIDNKEELVYVIKRILSNSIFRIYTFTNMLGFGALLTYVSVAPLVALVNDGFNQFEFSIAFGLVGTMQIAASLFAPKMIEKVGARKTVLLGSLVIVLGGIGILIFGSMSIILFFLMSSLGASGFSLMAGAAISQILEPFQHCAGIATSLEGFIRMLGGATMVALAGLIPLSGTMSLGLLMTGSIFATLLLVQAKG
ncbi:multidrug effflux MFS transporter [Vibrio mediterranei]|uniref:multidrug effflux MFS transporter n=1 Tax=Vibrio mediterranei TaxID=689 RepID=UPI002284BBED|nr:multidrug effflux MFS transporter [Vibrio mediterranei]MCY9855858.1 multidrug effflux MFS transporter [Vibrio mediterranei]